MANNWNEYWESDWEGCTLLDQDGRKVGTVEDVYYDTATQEPEWIRVHTGLFGMKQSIVPLSGASLLENRTIQVPYDKEQIKEASSFDVDQEISTDEEQRIYDFYGLSWSNQQSQTGLADSGQAEFGTPQSEFAPSTNPERDATTTDNAMTRSEEQLRVGTVRRPSELVRLRKHIVVEPQTVTVPVEREEFHIEREPITEANIDQAMQGPDLTESTHEVILMEDVPEVRKEVVPQERVRLEKDTITDNVEVNEELRKEQIDVDHDKAGHFPSQGAK